MRNLFSLTLAFGLSAMLFSCTQQPKSEVSTEAAPQVASADTLMIEDAGQDEILKQYLALKNALVASDAQTTQQEAKSLLALSPLKNLAKAYLMTDSIANTNDLVKQRSTFTHLSNELIPVLKNAPVAKGSFYVQFCPMANEGRGGYWLAAEQEVKNPYYGDEMLNCGEVKETIK